MAIITYGFITRILEKWGSPKMRSPSKNVVLKLVLRCHLRRKVAKKSLSPYLIFIVLERLFLGWEIGKVAQRKRQRVRERVEKERVEKERERESNLRRFRTDFIPQGGGNIRITQDFLFREGSETPLQGLIFMGGRGNNLMQGFAPISFPEVVDHWQGVSFNEGKVKDMNIFAGFPLGGGGGWCIATACRPRNDFNSNR